jgi:hypothetical protein
MSPQSRSRMRCNPAHLPAKWHLDPLPRLHGCDLIESVRQRDDPDWPCQSGRGNGDAAVNGSFTPNANFSRDVWLLVADEPVRLEIARLDLDRVRARLGDVGNVAQKGAFHTMPAAWPLPHRRDHQLGNRSGTGWRACGGPRIRMSSRGSAATLLTKYTSPTRSVRL